MDNFIADVLWGCLGGFLALLILYVKAWALHPSFPGMWFGLLYKDTGSFMLLLDVTQEERLAIYKIMNISADNSIGNYEDDYDE